MAIKILDLSYRSKVSQSIYKVPYLIVNCVLKIDRGNDFESSYYYEKAKGASEEYKRVVVTGSPEEEEHKFKETLDRISEEGCEDGIDYLIETINSSPPPEMVWTYAEAHLTHIKKFDVFWFREWIADCNVTRYILQELREFQTRGKLSQIYRTTDEEIVLKHLETLHSYWD